MPPLALSHPQQRTWYSEVLHPGTSVGNLCGAMVFEGATAELPALADALRAIIDEHDALRLRLVSPDGVSCDQVLVDELPETFETLSLDDTAPLRVEGRKPLQVVGGPLYRFVLLRLPDRIGVFFNYHHAVIDALSVSYLNRCIHARFLRLSGRDPEAEEPARKSYLSYLERERAYLASTDFRDDEAFWRAEFDGYTPPVDPLPETRSIRTERYEHALSEELSERIQAFCAEQQTSLFRFFMAMLQLYFSRLAGRDDVVVATGSHGRLDARAGDRSDMQMAGMTVGTVPIRVRLDGAMTISEFLLHVRKRVSACVRHQAYPFDLLARHLRSEGIDPRGLLEVMFNQVPAFVGPYTIERYSPGADLAPLAFKLNPNQRPADAPLELCVDARVERYAEAEIRLLFARLEELIVRVMEHPDAPLSELNVLTSAEREELLTLGRGEPLPTPAPCVLERFAQHVEDQPNALAVRDADAALSYAELDAHSARLATLLKARGVVPGLVVAIVTERHLGYVVATLACARLGAPFVLLTPDLPRARLDQIRAQAEVALTLCDASAPWSPETPGVLHLDDVDLSDVDMERSPRAFTPRPDDIAYLIFTSGSTGEPKGVQVPHRALRHLCAWNNTRLGIAQGDACAAYCSFTFDPAVLELWAPLVAGASLHIVPSATRLSVHQLGGFFRDHGVSYAILPTGVARLFAATVEEVPLRALVVGGEDLRAIRRRDYTVFNGYGPAEAAVYVTLHPVTEDDGDIPIGSPAPGNRVYIVDHARRLVPRGEVGNLLIAGPQVARGYVGRPDLSAERFVPNPFTTGPEDAVAYDTGDLVCWREDGTLSYRGRVDRQIKVRGMRVELGEIERRLLAIDGVLEAVVLDVDGHLCAFHTGSSVVDEGALVAQLGRDLPSWMVPERIVRLDTIPLTPNGKTDEVALIDHLPQAKAAVNRDGGTLSARERLFLDLFRTALDQPDLGPDDDFFAYGGDSLLAMGLFVSIHDALNEAHPVGLIFAHPTARTLAAALGHPSPQVRGADLVPLRHGSPESPTLFCFHDFTGDVVPYGNLATAFTADLNMIGVRFTWRGPDTERTIEELAGRFLPQLREAAGGAPAVLIGYSIGGLVAYEVAQRLRAEGYPVALLAVIDTPNFAADAGVWRRLANRVMRHLLAWFRAMSFSYKVMFVASSLQVMAATEGGAVGYVRALGRMKGMLKRYRPRSYGGPMVLIKAADRAIPLDAHLGWRGLPASLVELEVEGNHISVLGPEHAPAVARIIEAQLARRAAAP